MMKEIQTVRAICAVLFLFCGFGLIRYASPNRETWCVIAGCLGILMTILGIVAVFLFLKEFIRGFSWDNPRPQPKMQLASSSFDNPDNSDNSFELFKYIIEQETKDNKEFNLLIHNSTVVFKPIKKNIRLNEAKDEIIMTVCESPYPTFPYTVVLKKEGHEGPSPRYVLVGTLFESLDAEGYLLKYKDELKQRQLI